MVIWRVVKPIASYSTRLVMEGFYVFAVKEPTELGGFHRCIDKRAILVTERAAITVHRASSPHANDRPDN